MANFFTKIIDRSLDRIATKSHTTTLTTINQDNFSFLPSFFGWKTKGNYDLKKMLDAFENHPLVFEIVDEISLKVSSIPLKVEKTNGQEVVISKIMELLTHDLRYQIVASMESAGNCFLYFRKGVGMGEEVVFWVASDVSITTSISTGKVTKYQYTDRNTLKVTTIQGEDLKNILHLKNKKITSLGLIDVGLSKLTPMWDVVESSREKFTASKAIFKNRGIAGIISNNSELPLQPKARDEQQKDFDKQVGGADKFNKLYVTANRVNYLQLGMSPTDLKLIEGLTEDQRRLCSAYHLSSVLFNDVANSKFDNMEEAIKQAYLNCFIPTSEKIYIPLFAWLSRLLNVDEVPKVDKSQIESIKASTNIVATALSAFDRSTQQFIMGEMTSEEIRDLVQLQPLGTGQVAVGRNTTQNGQQGT